MKDLIKMITIMAIFFITGIAGGCCMWVLNNPYAATAVMCLGMLVIGIILLGD